MLIDIRHHIITLVAVFLALAVGIIVGGSFISGSSVERYIAKSLKEEFSKLSAENVEKQTAIKRLTEWAEKREEFDRTVAPLVVHGQLPWRRVAVIQTGDYAEATRSAKTALEMAGAQVLSVTTLPPMDTPTVQEQAARTLGKMLGDYSPDDPVGRLLALLANCISDSPNPAAMRKLADEGLVKISGDYSRRATHVLIVGGCREEGSDRARNMDGLLIEKLRAAGAITVVGAEPLDAVTSYIPVYRLKGIPTVDHVDQAIGQVALVFAMKGETGHFGLKRTADRVAPVYLESEEWRNRFQR